MKYFSLLKEKTKCPIVNFRLPQNQLRELTFVICHLSIWHELKILITTSPRAYLQSRRARPSAIQADSGASAYRESAAPGRGTVRVQESDQLLWDTQPRGCRGEVETAPGGPSAPEPELNPAPGRPTPPPERRIAKGNKGASQTLLILGQTVRDTPPDLILKYGKRVPEKEALVEGENGEPSVML